MRAGVLLDRRPDVESALKSPPKKCRNSDTLGFWGVGASGSKRTTTNDALLPESADGATKVMSGGIEVSNGGEIKIVVDMQLNWQEWTYVPSSIKVPEPHPHFAWRLGP